MTRLAHWDLDLMLNPLPHGVESFLPQDVKYFNWRFLMTNNVEANPPISPSIDTFMVTYRFEQVR